MAKRKVLKTGAETMQALAAGETLISLPGPPQGLHSRLETIRARIAAVLQAHGINADNAMEATRAANELAEYKPGQQLKGKEFRTGIESSKRKRAAQDAAVCWQCLEKLDGALAAGEIERAANFGITLGAMLVNLSFAENWLELVVQAQRAAKNRVLGPQAKSKLTEAEREFCREEMARQRKAGNSVNAAAKNVVKLLKSKLGVTVSLNTVMRAAGLK